ncbi:hypothetical protein TIFTF001_032833 [Ficus carica]|uniref:Uncharacterized protein n=1 Tax=Ficus carica TaxID=3494 RepID=A0AA88J8E8_FICCA|nr:hypothetical protein TIFTF001_032833 [Ficus carica]
MKIDFPSAKEILVRKRVEKEAVKPSNVLAQPPTKKQKAGEKPAKKALGKRKREQDKAITLKPIHKLQATEEEKVGVEVNMPPGTSLLYNKKLSVQLIHQLITDADMNTVNNGQIQDHLNEFSWDGLKCILSGMGLIYCSTDKAVEQREQIMKLEATDRFEKEYKQGLFVDVNVVEEIELYEESLVEAEASTSAAGMNVEPPTSVIPLITKNPNLATYKLRATDEPGDDPLETEKAVEH